MKKTLLGHVLACTLAGAMTLGGATVATLAAPTPAIAAPAGAIRPQQTESTSYSSTTVTLEAEKTYAISGNINNGPLFSETSHYVHFTAKIDRGMHAVRKF